MLSLILDENISPNISKDLWELGIDNFPVRDRKLLGAPDHVIWALGREQDRTIVTINEVDYRAFALRDNTHPGVLTIPSGSPRSRQLDDIMLGIERSQKQNGGTASFRDRIVYVQIDGQVRTEVVCACPTPQIIALDAVKLSS